jgi:hypothetical protein
MPGPTQITIAKDSEIERRILHYTMRAQEMMLNQFSLRQMLAEADKLYQREKNWTQEEWAARVANKNGDAHKFRDITVPIVMPQVQAALGYMTNVFLTGYPIFGVSASPQYEDAAAQMEAIVAENQETAQWARELMMFFGDGLKYNIHAVECSWEQKTVFNIEPDMTQPSGAKPKKAVWKGNIIKRMDLYNTYWDPRVAPADICTKGEYAGYNEVMTRVRMKQLCNDLFGVVSADTVTRALNSTPAQGITTIGSAPYAYYIPLINPYPTMLQNRQQAFDWMSWALDISPQNGNINYANSYIVTKMYAKIIPSTFGLNVPEANTPQVWKFIIVNGQVVLYAERQSNAHNYLPIFFGQPIEDGLMYQTKSFATDVEDMQQVASAMWNGFIASKRRLVTDRVIYDPLRIRKDDINSPNPSAKIPVRPGAYGKPVAESVYQFPYHDENASSFIQAANMIVQFANLINGQNPAQQGQFVKGNKTKHEYEDIMGHGNVRNQMMALMTENQVFTPLKVAIKMNILQFQENTSIYNQATQQNVDVQIDTIRQASVNFKVSDGIIPADKMLSEDEFANALQVLGSSPQIASGYNMAPLFSYIMKTRGADLKPFEKSQQQVQYEQQLQAWQQAAAQAAQKGSPFSTPMPQPPPAQPGATSGSVSQPGTAQAPSPQPAVTGANNSDALATATPAGTGD